VVTAVHEPGKQPGDSKVSVLEHSDSNSKAGNRSHVSVKVRFDSLATQVCHQVFSEQLSLTNGVLSVWNAVAPDPVSRKIWDGGVVSRGPSISDDVFAINNSK
jgi:hypothetical protein